jgi:hypothetical protein
MGLEDDLTDLINANADKISRLSGWIQKATKGGLLVEQTAKMPSGQSIRVNLLRGKLARAQRLQKVLHASRSFVRENTPKAQLSFVEQVAGFEGLPEG